MRNLDLITTVQIFELTFFEMTSPTDSLIVHQHT